MTPKDSLKIINNLSKSYQAKGATVEELDKKIWKDILCQKDIDYNRANRACTLIRKAITPSDTFGRLPEITDFLQYYQKTAEAREYHPCCGGTGWVFIERINKLFRCWCRKGEKPFEMKRQSAYLPTPNPSGTDPMHACISFHCEPIVGSQRRNTKPVPCPLGSKHYNEHMALSVERLSGRWDYIDHLYGNLNAQIKHTMETN